MRKLYRQIRLFFNVQKKRFLLLQESLHHWVMLCKYNAGINTHADQQKMEYTILRENHVIEKGMSLRTPRLGFGQEKVKELLRELRIYHKLYGNPNNFLYYPLQTIQSYIDYMHVTHIAIPEIEDAHRDLADLSGIEISSSSSNAGIKPETKTHLHTLCNGNFDDLLHSRHSIRYYSDEIPSKEVIEKALELAQLTPSACNRQAWHTHVYFGDVCCALLQMQGGCRGFEKEIKCAIVVTADMKGFLPYEPYQEYIDGGLYAMNLINALHSLGLGTIPLSCGFTYSKLEDIKQKFCIPQNETLIVIIGTGILLNQFNIAISSRKHIAQTNRYHE